MAQFRPVPFDTTYDSIHANTLTMVYRSLRRHTAVTLLTAYPRLTPVQYMVPLFAAPCDWSSWW